MTYQVDQSNKMERSGDTALALSNAIEYTIRIPAREKRKAFEAMAQRRKGRRKKWINLQLFAAALYYLLLRLPAGEMVVIDIEYMGHEDNIKNVLLLLLRRNVPAFDADRITFGSIGKKSPAHRKALAVYRGATRADRTLKADDLLKQIIGQ